MMALSRAALVLAGLVAAAGCHRRSAQLACVVPEGSGVGSGIATSHAQCFDGTRACLESQSELAQPGACVPIARPTWHCFAVGAPGATVGADASRGSDTPSAISECYPSLALCTAARPPQPSGGGLVVGLCAPVDEVYCHRARHALACAATEDDCAARHQLAAAVADARGSATGSEWQRPVDDEDACAEQRSAR